MRRQGVIFSIAPIYIALLLSTLTKADAWVDSFLKSKKLDLQTLKAYQELFIDNVCWEPEPKLTRMIEDTFTQKWIVEATNAEFQRQKLHLTYACKLAYSSETDLSHILIAVHTKFLAYHIGLNFMNCAIFNGSGYRMAAGSCKKLAKELLTFTLLGFKQLGKRLEMALTEGKHSRFLAKQLLSRIKKMFIQVDKSLIEYLDFLFLGNEPPNTTNHDSIYELFHQERNEEFYNGLCEFEDGFVRKEYQNLKKITECIKQDLSYKSERIVVQNTMCIPFKTAKVLWSEADMLYITLFESSHIYDEAITTVIRNSMIKFLVSNQDMSFSGVDADDLRQLPSYNCFHKVFTTI